MIIDRLNLEPLSFEGGYFRQTWSSGGGTAIYYLLTDEPESFSRMHKLPSDELWHFYCGDPVELLLLHPDGSGEVLILGSDIGDGQRPQIAVQAETWQGARIVPGIDNPAGYALLGTTMFPGFRKDDFVPGDREELCVRYPAFADFVGKLVTR